MFDSGGAGGGNVIMEVIFLQLARMDVLIMSYRLSSASSTPGYQKVVMMSCGCSCDVVVMSGGGWGHRCQPATAGGSFGQEKNSGEFTD